MTTFNSVTPADPLVMTATTIVSSLGLGMADTLSALRQGRSGLSPCAFDNIPFPTYVGAIAGLEDEPLVGAFAGFDCRNNRAAALALRQVEFADAVAVARARHGATRIGVFVGTSTSGLHQTESAYRCRDPATGRLPSSFDYDRTHNTYSLGRFVRAFLSLTGPALVISAACASTAKVFASAARMIKAGICDAAVVGGADTLCATTLFGFYALGVVAETPCRPFDITRCGISIGEAAGFVLVERASDRAGSEGVSLLGYGESADAFHMSSPHPDGIGARLAMERALSAASIAPTAIDYVNLHGTATPAGDAAEDRAVFDLFGATVPCSSTKGFTGHALGASGVIEAIITMLAIQHAFVPGSPHTATVDPDFCCRYMRDGATARINRAISNSFGFGGANCSLVLGRSI
jgi:3-oxoacyl-[acyl-carrier-protein] synthase I